MIKSALAAFIKDQLGAHTVDYMVSTSTPYCNSLQLNRGPKSHSDHNLGCPFNNSANINACREENTNPTKDLVFGLGRPQITTQTT